MLFRASHVSIFATVHLGLLATKWYLITWVPVSHCKHYAIDKKIFNLLHLSANIY